MRALSRRFCSFYIRSLEFRPIIAAPRFSSRPPTGCHLQFAKNQANKGVGYLSNEVFRPSISYATFPGKHLLDANIHAREPAPGLRSYNRNPTNLTSHGLGQYHAVDVSFDKPDFVSTEPFTGTQREMEANRLSNQYDENDSGTDRNAMHCNPHICHTRQLTKTLLRVAALIYLECRPSDLVRRCICRCT